MRAVRFHSKEDVRVEDVPDPIPGHGQIRLKPAYVGICGTDVHEYTRGATLIPIKAHPLTSRVPPLTLGHEISGTIDAVGSGVSDLFVDDHVAVQPIISDGTCYACHQGRPNCCTKQGFYGLSADGGLAEYMVVDAKNARKVPRDLSLELIALVEPLAVGWHAVRTNIPAQCNSALVIGAGPIGLAIVQALKARGVATIVVADVSMAKREYAMKAGAHHFIDSIHQDVVDYCMRIAPASEGVHVAFDTAGKQITLDQCVGSVCVGGTIINVAIWGGTASIFPNAFALGEKRYAGSSVYTDRDFDEVILSITTGIINPGFMVTTKISMNEFADKGIMKLLRDPGDTVKILVDLTSKDGRSSGRDSQH